MSGMDWLDAAEALVDEEMNDGVTADSEPEIEAPTGDTLDLTIDDQGRPHDASTGQFVSLKGNDAEETAGESQEPAVEPPADSGAEETPTADVAEDPAPADGEEDELVFELDDPELLEILEKYDGDPIKALKALPHAQSKIGEQGNELGELRQKLDQLIEQTANQPNPLVYAPYQSDLDESPDALAQEVIARTIETGHFDEQTYSAAIEAWGEIDPFAAARFDARVSMAQQMAQQQAAAPPADEPAEDLAGVMDALKERNPDIQQNLPVIEKLAAERPLMRQALYEGTPHERAQALEDLNALARTQRTDADTSSAARKVLLRVKAEADAARADATVVGASRTSAADTPSKANAMLEQTLGQMLGDDDFVIE